MSCTLHVAKKYEIEWEGGWLNWGHELFKAVVYEINARCRAKEIDEWGEFNCEYYEREFELNISEDIESVIKEFCDELMKNPDDVFTMDTEDSHYIPSEIDSHPAINRNIAQCLMGLLENYDRNNNYMRLSFF